MKNPSENREILEELERRKNAKENPCDVCGGSGKSSLSTEKQTLVCGRCLGQGVILTDEEHRMLKEMALTNHSDDNSILDATELY